MPYTDALLGPSDVPLAYLGCEVLLDVTKGPKSRRRGPEARQSVVPR